VAGIRPKFPADMLRIHQRAPIQLAADAIRARRGALPIPLMRIAEALELLAVIAGQ